MEFQKSQTPAQSTEDLGPPMGSKSIVTSAHSTEFLGYEYEWETTWDAIWEKTLPLGYDYESRHRNSLLNFIARNATFTDKETLTEKETLPDKEEKEPEYISGFRLAAVVGSITMVIFVLLLDVSIISTAVPRITSEFHSLEDVGWYSAAYQLSSASLQPLTGKFYTHFSVKWTFVFFVGLFEVGSLICGVASSSTMFIGGRAIAGLGGSGVINGGLTMIAGSVPPERRAFFTSLVMGFGQLGLITGPLIGGALTEFTTWRWCFYINLPIGAVAIAFLILTKIPDLTAKPPFNLDLIRKVIPELDLVGFVLFAPASVMLLLALQFGGNDYPWNSSVIIGLFCGSVVTAIVFALWEYRVGDKAMIPGSIITQKLAMSSAVQGMFLLGTVFVASIYFPLYFQAVKGAGPTLSGVYLLPSIFSQLVVVVASGWLISKLGFYTPWAIAGGAISAVGNGLVSTFSPTTATAQWIGYQLVLGIGRGCGMQTSMIAIQNGLPGRQIPVAIAFQIFCQNLLGSILLVIASVVFNQSLASEIAQHAPSVSPAAATAAGGSASGVRALLPEGSPELDGLLLAYSNSVDRIFYMLVACSVISFMASWGMGWTDTRKKNKPGPGGH